MTLTPHTCLALLSVLLLYGCPAPPVEIKPPPPPPVAVEPPTLNAEQFHELVLTPGRSYPGLELEYTLLDEAGETLHLDRMRIGAIFEPRRPLVAGMEHVRRIVRPEDLIKVVGGPRPRSALDRPALDLDRIRRASLRHVLACRRQEWVWNPGMELPPELDVKEMPEPGTVFLRNVCGGRAVQDPSLQRSFGYRRRQDPRRAWIDLKVLYNLGYPRGLTFTILLRDGGGGSVLRPGCRLQLRQPPVVPGTHSQYRIEFDGVAAVDRARKVASAQIVDLVPDAGPVHEATLDQLCR